MFEVLLGLPILIQGLLKRRKTAVWCGTALLAFAAIDVAIVYWAIRAGRPIPDIGLHAVLLFPVGIFLAIKGARALREPNGRVKDGAGKRP